MKGISIHKRIASVCITLAIMMSVLVMPINSSAATVPVTVTVTKAGQVVDTMTYEGVTVNAIYTPRNDSNAHEMWDDPVYCCAALVTKFYKAVYGNTVYNLWPGSTPLSDVGTFSKVKTPVVGDIYGNSSHWAIVKQVNGNEVVLFEQNWTWYDDYGCYAKYNRTVNLKKLESDVSFFRYSGADIPVKPVITTDYASQDGVEKSFSWTTGMKTAKSTLNIYKYNSTGTYSSSDLVSSTPNITGGSFKQILQKGHYAAQVINYSASNKSSSSEYKEFYVVGQPLASSVKLGVNSLNMTAGESKSVSSHMLPENTNDILTWSSSDSSVASVSNSGIVTAHRAGAVTITSKAVSGVKAVCTVTVKPKSIQNFKVSSYNTSSITMSWDTVPDISGYRIYRYDEAKKKYVKISDLKSNSFKVSGLSNASSYKFKVRAYRKYKGKNYFGKYSAVLTGYTRPNKVKDLRAETNSASSISLSWTSVYGADAYDVYASADSGKFKKLASVSGSKSSVKLKKLKTGASYAFKIKTVKKLSGVSVYSSNSKKAYATTKPGKVKNFKAQKASNGNITLTWNHVNGAAKYQIYMLNGNKYKRVKTVSSPKTKTKIKNLSANKQYKFKIRAYKKYNGFKYYGKYSSKVKV